MSEINLNDVVEETVEDALVMTVPIDDTLTVSGEAADAKAVGDALALKADLSAVKNIAVNEQAADNQGQILLTGEDVPMSGTDETTLKAAIDAAGGRTGADIPLNDDLEAPTIAEAFAESAGRNADAIPMSAEDETTVAARILALEEHTAGVVKTVNGIGPDENGNAAVNKVPLADNLDSSVKQQASGEFIIRASGGSASISDGPADLLRVMGNSVQEGFVPEVLEISTESESCEATVTDPATFRSAMGTSGTLVLTYTSSWSANPATYGITVTGTPGSGDTITVVWEMEQRGTITNATPAAFCATGWNLYNQADGYARVVRYSEEYGYAISGAYTKIEFSTTETGARTNVTPSGGSILFSVPGDGYVWVTGGNATTAIWATWSDWVTGYKGEFETYTQQTIDLSDVLASCFPDGMCSVGNIRDYMDLAGKNAYRWIDVMEYSAENLAAAEASGRPYLYDVESIYLARASAEVTPLTGALAVSASYTASEHGEEFFEGTLAPAGGLTRYGMDLRNKLERDVVTLSQQDLTAAQRAQVRENLDVPETGLFSDLFKVKTYTYTYGIVAANAAVVVTGKKFGISTPSGYTPIGIVNINTDASALMPYYWNEKGTGSDQVLKMRNITSSATSTTHTCSIKILYVKKEFV